jgi:hypothetical protein
MEEGWCPGCQKEGCRSCTQVGAKARRPTFGGVLSLCPARYTEGAEIVTPEETINIERIFKQGPDAISLYPILLRLLGPKMT